MKRVLLVSLSITLLVISFLGCEVHESGGMSSQPSMETIMIHEDEILQTPTKETSKEDLAIPAKLIVNGQNITESNHACVYRESKTAMIPVLATFRALGYDVEMHNKGDGIYRVLLNDEIEVLAIAEASVGQEDSYARVVEDEILVDVHSVFSRWYWVWNIDIDIDFDADIIYINSFDPDAYEEYRLQLIVDGKDITEENDAYLQEYYTESVVELPLLAIVKALGAQVTWEDSEIITIEFEGKETTLDLSAEDFGWLIPPGGIAIRKATDTEVYMELSSVRITLKSFFGADIHVDYDQHIAYVDFLDNE